MSFAIGVDWLSTATINISKVHGGEAMCALRMRVARAPHDNPAVVGEISFPLRCCGVCRSSLPQIPVLRTIPIKNLPRKQQFLVPVRKPRRRSHPPAVTRRFR
ncbi:hypothetical protein NQ315_011778 [Exocentrus adspersus]|uniref:Uncharacterized protein n=1 Tax=Exocentrus adspersus TaxID=1586481 RepID=A0AAV8W216_9CUCU|nr:hypothetical protein NQ315_011778 [Exocentrus adspersus]